jgi:hypothetical protein
MSATSNTNQQTSQQGAQNSTSSTNPWAPQIPYLQQAFSGAQTALGNANANYTTPSGFVAGLTPDQIATFNQMVGAGSNPTSNPTVTGEANAGGALTTGGTNATLGSLASLGSFNPADTNNMGSTVAGANQYAAGENIPAQVQADMQMANQEANEVTLPGIDQAAAGSGNINSSRTGVAQGLVQQGLSETAANLGSQLEANAYNTGANLTQNQNVANNSALITALLGGASGGVNAVNSGVSAGTGSIGNESNLFNVAATGGAGQQSGQQDTFSNQLQQNQFSQTAPFTALQNYLGLVNGNYGGTSTSSGTSSMTGTTNTQTTPSILSVLGGLLGGGGSLLGGIGSLLGSKSNNPTNLSSTPWL